MLAGKKKPKPKPRPKPTYLATEERRLPNAAGKVVSIQVARKASGGLAYYFHGAGPFLSNRAARRAFTGEDGRHDGSKKPTPGRVKRDSPPWRGARARDN